MINPSNLQSMLILILADMQYKDNCGISSTKTFIQMTAIMNFVTVACLFEAIYYSIFEYLLAASSEDRRLLGPVSTYFSIVETNSQGILYLHYLIWLQGDFHISQLCD